jgi:predicted acylesterase/phospholipase RssA
VLHHLLFVASQTQIERTKAALARLDAQPISHLQSAHEAFYLKHQLLDKLALNIHLISDLDAITPHLRRFPVDLLIYDERERGIEAQSALRKIRADVEAFGELWGPDFLFPMSRVVAIIDDKAGEGASRAFELGRSQVRDVCIAPRSTAHVLRWLSRVLLRGFVREPKVGMGLSGGGLEGFLYQIGVLHALHKGIQGRSLRSIDTYSGISSGSICATLMAGNVPTGEMIRALHGKSDILAPMEGGILFDLATGDITKRVMRETFSWAGLDPTKWGKKIMQSVPTGLFKGDALRKYFKEAIESYGYEDQFQKTGPEVFIGATDQDTFEHVTFGKPPWDTVPISEALRASCALPPFFTPTQVNGRWFIDGQVTKTVNLELLVDRGCNLIIIVDPMRPLGTLIPGSVDRRGGVYAVIQTIKALVNTRFQSALAHMTERFPDVDFLVFQPDEECAHLMAGSPMRYRIRTQIVSAAYRHTLRQLRERHAIYQAKLGRFGFELKPVEELLELECRQGDVLEAIT